ncbi:MAG: hypothetical protein MK085_07685, partial [Phycisphaerales bacterium]|nr:hypothetical protein [Phycisphaerales bacterium]
MPYHRRTPDRDRNRCVGPLLGLMCAWLVISVVAPLSGATAQCPSETGDCLEAHPTPGCTDQECCLTVCDIDPACCKDLWDSLCVEYANFSCSSLCGAEAAGSCFVANGTPGCNDASCCDSVCLIDPFCCESQWDGNCAFTAGFSCQTGGGKCGDPAAGSCDDPNGIPACDNEACCELVCEQDPRCCDTTWDIICVAYANAFCESNCQLVPPGTAIIENESCGDSVNNPCEGGTADEIICGEMFAGTSGDIDDIDLVKLVIEDEDGDGAVRVRVQFASSTLTRLSVISGSDPCSLDPPAMVIDSYGCQQFNEIACLPAGDAWLRVEPLEEPPICIDEPINYQVQTTCVDYCGEPCENPMPCLEVHASPGCEDSECCEAVCDVDPICCEWTWDSLCTVTTAELCGGDPPANDKCIDATPALTGATPFRQLLSTIDPLASSECLSSQDDTTGDIWLRHVVRCDGRLVLGTCSSADFDTVMEVYRDDCDDLELIACNDDNSACQIGTSLVEIEDVPCGESILIRIVGKDDSTGSGVLSIVCF